MKRYVQNQIIEILVINCATKIVVIIVLLDSFSAFFFYCVLLNHTFQTNPNTVTKLSKLFNYICSMRSLFFYTFFLGAVTDQQKRALMQSLFDDMDDNNENFDTLSPIGTLKLKN